MVEDKINKNNRCQHDSGKCIGQCKKSVKISRYHQGQNSKDGKCSGQTVNTVGSIGGVDRDYSQDRRQDNEQYGIKDIRLVDKRQINFIAEELEEYDASDNGYDNIECALGILSPRGSGSVIEEPDE